MGWELELAILREVREARQDLAHLRKQFTTLVPLIATLAQQSPVVSKALVELGSRVDSLNNKVDDLDKHEMKCCETLNAKLDEIIEFLIPPPPGPVASFKVSVTAINPTEQT